MQLLPSPLALELLAVAELAPVSRRQVGQLIW